MARRRVRYDKKKVHCAKVVQRDEGSRRYNHYSERLAEAGGLGELRSAPES